MNQTVVSTARFSGDFLQGPPMPCRFGCGRGSAWVTTCALAPVPNWCHWSFPGCLPRQPAWVESSQAHSNCVTLCDSRDPREGSQAGTVRLRSALAEAPWPCSAIAGGTCWARGLHPHTCAAELAVNLCTEPGSLPGNRALAFLTAESPKM